METTWMPHDEHGKIHDRAELLESVYAFPRQRKEPLTDAAYVKNALARFDQVERPKRFRSRPCFEKYKESCRTLRGRVA